MVELLASLLKEAEWVIIFLYTVVMKETVYIHTNSDFKCQ